MIQFKCQCGKKYLVPEQYAGKKVRCKECDAINIIPQDSPEESAEETLYQEVPSSNKILIFLCLGIIVLVLGGFGFLIYSQHTKVKECLTDCESLHIQAQIKWDNKDYAGAKDIYKNIIERALKTSTTNSELVSLTEDAKEKIKEAEDILFAEKYLAEIKDGYHQAEGLLKSEKIGLARSKYREIVSFIKKHNKQNDDDFKWFIEASQKRIKLILEIEDLLTGLDSYRYQPRHTILERYNAVLIDLANSHNTSDEDNSLATRLKELRKQANTYYDEQDEKKRLAEQERQWFATLEKTRQQEQKRLEEAQKQRQIDNEMADMRIKNAAQTLFPKTKEIIKSALKSPSTASFEDPTYAVYKSDEDIRNVLVAEWDNQYGDYTSFCQFKKQYPDAVILWFSGKVNAQNSFGAMLQTKWFCIYFYSPSQDQVEFLKYNIK